MEVNVNIDEALQQDKNMQQGFDAYREMEEKANAVAETITESLVESIIKQENDFSISTAILAVAKSMAQLASFLYDNEQEFITDFEKARESITADVIPALLDPQSCGLCDSCKNGIPEQCLNPNLRTDYTLSKFLPLIANVLIEYDLFNKIIFMHTIGRSETGLDQENDFDQALSIKSKGEENGSSN